MSNPKPKKFTPQQERELEGAEKLQIRAHVFHLGVSRLLSECPCNLDIEVCAQLLAESAQLTREGYSIRARASGPSMFRVTRKRKPR